jgi:hypothetical protein
MELRQLLELERGFWLGGAAFYRRHLTDDFLMLFPGPGAMNRTQTIEGIEGGQRWVHLETSEERVLRLTDDCRLLCYGAKARREDDMDYAAVVSSVYVLRDGAWQLAFHQQSPTG